MRIAVVGGGISGLGAAWLLGSSHEVTLFEAEDYLGGHTDTQVVEIAGRQHAVDTGFIAYNPRHYPYFTRLLTELGVPVKDTQMTFAVTNEGSGLQYSTASVNALFRQRRNLISRRFHRMLKDIKRFYAIAPAVLNGNDLRTLGGYLLAEGFSDAFRDEHIVPLCTALWSAPPAAVLGYPVRFVVQFMANHEMLTLGERSSWKVVDGGSASYIRALETRWNAIARVACPVFAVRRTPQGVVLTRSGGLEESFDQVVLACHTDQALRMLSDVTPTERAVLGAIPYQRNEVVLHTDASFLPRKRGDWAAWNALVPAQARLQATVSYCMNVLQGIDSPEAIVVTLNPTRPVAPGRVLKTLAYSHPQFTPAAVAAQSRRGEIQGVQGTWFTGAYWGFGFHEDGLASAVEVARALGVHESIAADPQPDAGGPA
jgi:predicted NAD/FAD-binding protein